MRVSKAMLGVVAVTLPLSAASAGDTWIKDTDSGCEIWSPEPVGANSVLAWSGGCNGGKAEGMGTLTWMEGSMERARSNFAITRMKCAPS